MLDVVVEQAIRLLRGIGYSGICGVEFKLDAATGEHKLIEINARPVNTIGLAPACGVDIPHVAYRDLMGESVAPEIRWRDGVAWYRAWNDFFAVRELRRTGRASYLQWWKSLWGARTEAVMALDDLRPALDFFGEMLLKELSSQARKRLFAEIPQKV